MMERLKTLALTLLVAASLLQSYMLAYSSPKLTPINPSQYVRTEPFGTPADLSRLVAPMSMILHQGDGSGKTEVLYPGTSFYQLIQQTLQDRAFDGLRQLDPLEEPDWEQVRADALSMELPFLNPVPLSVLSKIFTIRSDPAMSPLEVQRIWLVGSVNSDEVNVYFVTEPDDRVYEATNSNLTAKDLQNFVDFGQNMPEYTEWMPGVYYPKDDSVSAMAFSLTYRTITPDQLENSLFVDPDITRNIVERDGTEIYTDGKRGVQIKSGQNWLVYSDPIAPTDTKNNLSDDLVTATQFINRRGGWDGPFYLQQVQQSGTSGSSILFRQYLGDKPYGLFPVIATSDFQFGSIQAVLQNGTVTEYQRSMLQLASKKEKTVPMDLTGGRVLASWLEDSSYRGQIVALMPAYHPVLAQGRVDFSPIWAVELADGTLHALNG